MKWIIYFKGDKPNAYHELELKTIAAREKEMERLVEKHSGKRQQESLLEAHQKEMKKKRKVHIEVKTKADSNSLPFETQVYWKMTSFGMRCCVVWLLGPSKSLGTYLPKHVMSHYNGP